MSHPLRRTRTVPRWPSYTGTSHYVGTSPTYQVAVYVDPALGNPGLQNGQDLLTDADRIAAANSALFGSATEPVDVIVFAIGGQTDGTGGADHNACNFTDGGAIEVCASFGNSARVGALFEAELSECSMGGNLCGVSTGEALSRWCAAVVGHDALADFATAPTWAKDGMPNFVDRTDPTDQSADSTGCGMAFLSWMMSLGMKLDAIAPAMVRLGTGGTLAQLYAALIGGSASSAWPKFLAAAKALPPITSDDPFAAAAGALKKSRRPPRAAPRARRPHRR